jgi:predicted O-methyltransferase YrrM
MSQTRWEEVDAYLVDTLLPRDNALTDALAASAAAGLPAIQVSPPQGRLLEMLARAIGARRILEIGTLGGYSTLWLARGITSGGKLITIEHDPKHAEVARANFARAGRSTAIDLRVGAALDLLPQLEREHAGPFNLIFVDADKVNLPDYLTWSVRLSRPGSLIVIDNVIREGEVVNAESTDAAVQGVRRMYERIAKEPRVSATAIQTVGGKGYDGLAFVLVDR